RLGLCQLIFFTGLKGNAKQWFEGLSSQMQDNWNLLKAAFNEKYSRVNKEEQTMRKFYHRAQQLRQNTQTLQQYITEADQLADSLNQQTDKNAVGFLADSFVNGIANEYHQYLIKITLPSEIYTYEQVKTAAEKVINSSTKALKPPVTTATPTWITATAQPAETPDPSSELARTLQEINKRLANLEQLLQSQYQQYQQYPQYRQRMPWSDVTCFNCMEPGHTVRNYSLQPVSWSQAQANREEVKWRQEEQQQNRKTITASRRCKSQSSSGRQSLNEEMATAAATLTEPAITHTVPSKKEIPKCLYIIAWINGHLLPRTLVDSRANLELISPDTLQRIHIIPKPIEGQSYAIRMASDKLVFIKEYAKFQVNVAGVGTWITAYMTG
ncbi:MAG: hypothetical protein M1839_003645, partial [Geoglossum umbratile]